MGLEPTSSFLAVPVNQLDKSALTSLIGYLGGARKVSRGFESQAESFSRKTLDTLVTLV